MKCPTCGLEVYFAEKFTHSGKDYHKTCLKCKQCAKVLTPGKTAEHGGDLYCPIPCYRDKFGPHGKK